MVPSTVIQFAKTTVALNVCMGATRESNILALESPLRTFQSC